MLSANMISANRQNPIISQLDSFGVIKISGEQRDPFLQGQLSINVESIKADQLSLATICNPQGRCISLFFITAYDDAYWLVLPQDAIELTLTSLKKYAVFYKTEIVDSTAQYQLYATHQLSAAQDKDLEKQCKPLWLAKMPEPAIGLLLVEQPANSSFESHLIDSLTDISPLGSEQDWLYRLAHHQIAWLSAKSQIAFLPHNLNLPKLNAVDFKKGCFTGQEVIARMHYKGKLKSHLHVFLSDQSIQVSPLDNIYVDDNKAAQVVCSATNGEQQTAVLALMRDSYLNQQKFHLGQQNGPILELLKTN